MSAPVFMVVVVIAAFLFCQWRRKRRQQRQYYPSTITSPYIPDVKVAMTPPPPVLDPEMGVRQMHDQHNSHAADDMSSGPGYDASQYDRQASTAAWAQGLPQPPASPSQADKEAETGIIRIFRWPTISSRSELTALARTWATSTSSTRNSGGNGAAQRSDKSEKTSSWTSRASRSTLSTMLYRSRRSIARRRGEDVDGHSPEEESGILRDAQPVAVMAEVERPPPVPPVVMERQPIPARKPVQVPQRLEVRREKSRRRQRESALTVSSAGGGSIASSGVLSPTLMAFPVPPKGASSLSVVYRGDDEDLPPLPATVYKPYRAEGR